MHFKAQMRELVLLDQALRSCGGIEPLEIAGAEPAVELASRNNMVNDMIDDHEQRMGERHHRFPVPTPRRTS